MTLFQYRGHVKWYCLLCVTQAGTRLPAIAVFGGSGKLGSECVYQALKLGENVCAMTRNPSKMIPIPAGL